MAVYKLKGVSLAALETGIHVFQRFLGLNCRRADRLCLTCGTDKLHALDAAISGTSVDRVSIFNWREIGTADVFRESEFQSCRSAKIMAGPFEFGIQEHYEKPPYGWDEQRTETCSFMIQYREPQAQARGRRELNQEVRNHIQRVVNTHVPSASRGALSGSSKYWEDPAIDTYWLQVGFTEAPLLISDLCTEFALRDMRGSFEFAGDREFIESLRMDTRFSLTNYPQGLWHQHLGGFEPIFAIEPLGLLAPIPNLAIEEINHILKPVSDNLSNFLYLELLRTYLMWQTEDGQRSLASAGNYVKLTWEKGGFALELGLEQYTDEDIPVRQLIKPIQALTKELGGELKRVRY